MAKRYARKKSESGFQKRKRVYGSAAKLGYNDISAVAKQVAYLGTMINSEPMYHNVQSSNNINWLGGIVDLSNIPTGDGPNQRTGTSVLPRFLNLKLQLVKGLSGTSDHSIMRALVFRYWGESSTAILPGVPQVNEILATTGTQFAATSVLNRDNTGARGDRERRIEILRNELVCFDKVSNTCQMYSYNIEMNGPSKQIKEHIKYDSTATASAISGGIYFLVISDVTTATDCAYKLTSNLTFYDN